MSMKIKAKLLIMKFLSMCILVVPIHGVTYDKTEFFLGQENDEYARA